MSLFNLFGGSEKFNEGLSRFKQTPRAVLLDVRTIEEYKEGHVPQSKNLPLDEISTISLSKDQPLFVYCASGSRSGQAVRWLNSHGYHAENIGGIMSYKGPIQR